MLSRGFKEQIYDVFRFLPEKVQCALFSATMPLEVSWPPFMMPAVLQSSLCRSSASFIPNRWSFGDGWMAGAGGDEQVHA